MGLSPSRPGTLKSRSWLPGPSSMCEHERHSRVYGHPSSGLTKQLGTQEACFSAWVPWHLKKVLLLWGLLDTEWELGEGDRDLCLLSG